MQLRVPGMLALATIGLAACEIEGEIADVVGDDPSAHTDDRPALDADRSGDLTPRARALIDGRTALGGAVTLDDLERELGLDAAAVAGAPATIRVWRRGLDGSASSCGGRVDVIPFEQYVKGVLPHEWFLSWHGEALKMGAVAIRTYAAWWVAAGGKYACADVDDTTASQVYVDAFYPAGDAAVDATAGVTVVEGGALVFAEYSAEAGGTTTDGVSDPVCAGHPRKGHGRGLCQWGSQRWASQGRDYLWMASHYYPGAAAATPHGRLRGFVREGDLHDAAAGLDGATIALSSGHSASSAGDGRYLIEPLAAGDVTLTVTLPGYAPASRTVQIIPGQTTWGSVALVPE